MTEYHYDCDATQDRPRCEALSGQDTVASIEEITFAVADIRFILSAMTSRQCVTCVAQFAFGTGPLAVAGGHSTAGNDRGER